MKKVFRKNNLILFLMMLILATVLMSLIITQPTFAQDNNVEKTTSQKMEMDSVFFWGWWLLGVLLIVCIIIVKEILFYHYRLGIYGDIKLTKEMEQKLIEKATAKKPTYTQNPEVCSVLAGNKTVEIDTQTCLLKDKKRRKEEVQ